MNLTVGQVHFIFAYTSQIRNYNYMKVQKIILMAIAVFLPLLSVISCEDPLPESIPVTAVTLNSASMELVEGESQMLTAVVSPSNADNQKVIWMSSNSSVASVTEGKVTALKPGSATITVKTVDGGKTAICEVTVKARPKAEMLKIEFTNTSGSIGGDLYINGEYHFSVSAVPEDAFAEYEWSIEDEKIAELVEKNFDLRPAAIIRDLELRRPIYRQTAAYGHFGRTDVDLPWEHTDKAETLRQQAGL